MMNARLNQLLVIFIWLSAACLTLAAPGDSQERKGCRPVIDPENPRRMILIEPDGSSIPYLHIGRSAYQLLNFHRHVDAFLEDAEASGADTLRIFLVADWRYPWAGKWFANPWNTDPGTPKNAGDPEKFWWQEFDEQPGGYWDRLDSVLTKMAEREMVAELCLFDHFTMARLERDYPGEAIPFLVRMGSEKDDGRLRCLLDRLALSLQDHSNVILEIGNQIAAAWTRPGCAPGTDIPLMIAPRAGDDMDCALWMYDIANYLRDKFPKDRAPLMTNSARWKADIFFELTLKDGWNAPVSFHSDRTSDQWYLWNWNALQGPTGVNSGLLKTYAFPFIDNEPMTYGEKDRTGFTDGNPGKFRYHAWITAMAGGYHTYHSMAGINTDPDRALTEKQRAGQAYLPVFAAFWKSHSAIFNRLITRHDIVFQPETDKRRAFCAATPDIDCVMVYLLKTGEADNGELVLYMPVEGYSAKWLHTGSGEMTAAKVKTVRGTLSVSLDNAPWNDRDVLLILERKP